MEWPEQRLWHKFFGNGDAGRNAFTIRINEADSVLARDLVKGIESVKLGIV